jgi:DNA-binding transcriptional ArsR family regulator
MLTWLTNFLAAAPTNAVLRERLAQQEKDVAAKIRDLEARMEALGRELAEEKGKNKKLADALTMAQPERRSEECERVLLDVCLHDRCETADVAERLGLPEARARYHLGELREAGLIYMVPMNGIDISARPGSWDEWTIQQIGRRYLANHGLT